MRLFEKGEETMGLGSMADLRQKKEEEVLIEIDRCIVKLWRALQKTENMEVVSLLTQSSEKLRHAQCRLRHQIDPYMKRYGLALVDKQKKTAKK